MNINVDIVARALNKAGEEPLTKEEIENKKGTRWRLIKDLYLANILEMLSSVAWTSQKRRVKLERSEEENLSTYSYMYELPIDNAKPVGLNSEKEYLVEGDFLYTEDPEPILCYITNYFRGNFKFQEALPQPISQAEVETAPYYVKDEDGEFVNASIYDEEITYYTRVEEDYSFYADPKFDPILEEAVATKLAAKLVLKLTGNMNTYQMLYQEAMIMENRAQKASMAHGHNKGKGERLWGDQLGLPNYGED